MNAKGYLVDICATELITFIIPLNDVIDLSTQHKILL